MCTSVAVSLRSVMGRSVSTTIGRVTMELLRRSVWALDDTGSVALASPC